MKADFESLRLDDKNETVLRASIQLAFMKVKKTPLIEYMQQNIKKDVGIEEVRSRLAKIRTSMSEDIIKSRTERV
jgi:hypothetical protein